MWEWEAYTDSQVSLAELNSLLNAANSHIQKYTALQSITDSQYAQGALLYYI